MELFQLTLRPQLLFPYMKENYSTDFSSHYRGSRVRRNGQSSISVSSSRMESFSRSTPQYFRSPLRRDDIRPSSIRASKIEELLRQRGGKDEGEDASSESDTEEEKDDDSLMDGNERREWRQKIREVIGRTPDLEEEVDMVEKRKKMQKLLAEYPLVVEEDDPDWPENDDGWGFNLDQFFNKIVIKNVKKDDDEDYDSDKEIVWRDDNYIRPIKDITSAEWEEAVCKDISPLVVLVHNRYKRPKENVRIRDELEKAVQIIWDCQLPSPRCVAIDAVVELDLVSALQVSVFPELIFTKAGKILYREKVVRTADELSKMMAFFYFGAVKPPCLSDLGNSNEPIPTFERRPKSN